jgi:PmbA protein
MEDLAAQIVKKAQKLGCQDAVADFVQNRSYQIRFARNEPVISNRWRESYASVFLVYDKRVVATDIKDLADVDAALERLVKIAKTSQRNPEYAGLAKGKFKYNRVRPDPKVLALQDGSDFVEAAINGATAQGATECAGSFWRYEDEHSLATSNGVEGHDHRAGLYLSIRAMVSLESSGHGIACASRLSQFDPEKAGRKAGRIASLAKNPKGGKAGRYTVVFDPLIFGALTDQVAGRASAYAVLAGFSPFGKKVGKSVASPAVTMWDDGSEESLSRKKFDMEGVPTRRTAIIQRGILKTYLHNTSTAKRFKTKTTGNAGLVAPDPHAVFVKPGDWSRDEIFSEVKDGLWLTNTWYTRYQSYVSGDLSTIPRDGIFHIQKGEVVETWKDIRLTDNLIRLMKNVVALSDKTEQMMWWGEVSIPNFVPYAIIKDVNITRSAE